MRRFLGAGAWLFAGIMAGRILGLIRDILVSRFGASSQADIAVLAITVPDTMINILVGGAMGAALIPEFKRLNPGSSFRLYRQASLLAGLAALAISVGLMIGAEPLTRMLLQALPESDLPMAASLVRISLWAIPLTAMSAVARARLQSQERFAFPSLAGFFYNLAILGGLILALGMDTLRPVAVAAVLGALLSLLMQVGDLWRARGALEPTGGRLIDWSLVRRYGGALAAGAMVLVLPLIVRALASRYGEGSQSIAYLAAKLVDLPMGTLLSVVSIAMFPAIAECLAQEDRRTEAATLARQGIEVIVALALPIALGIGLFARDYSALLFGHGKMTAHDTHQIALMSSIMLVGLVFQAVNTMLLSFFNGLRDMRTPFLAGLAVLVGFLIAGALAPGLQWLAVAVAAFHVLLCFLLLTLLSQSHGVALGSALINPRALRRTCAGIAAFAFVGVPLWMVVSGTVPRVLSSLVAGTVALAVSVAIDPLVRERLRSALSNKLKRRA